MRLATLAIAIFSLVAGDHIIQPQSALGKSAAAASSRAYVSDFRSNRVIVVADGPLGSSPIGVAPGTITSNRGVSNFPGNSINDV